jgi:hypothetical protein
MPAFYQKNRSTAARRIRPYYLPEKRQRRAPFRQFCDTHEIGELDSACVVVGAAGGIIELREFAERHGGDQ